MQKISSTSHTGTASIPNTQPPKQNTEQNSWLHRLTDKIHSLFYTQKNLEISEPSNYRQIPVTTKNLFDDLLKSTSHPPSPKGINIFLDALNISSSKKEQNTRDLLNNLILLADNLILAIDKNLGQPSEEQYKKLMEDIEKLVNQQSTKELCEKFPEIADQISLLKIKLVTIQIMCSDHNNFSWKEKCTLATNEWNRFTNQWENKEKRPKEYEWKALTTLFSKLHKSSLKQNDTENSSSESLEEYVHRNLPQFETLFTKAFEKEKAMPQTEEERKELLRMVWPLAKKYKDRSSLEFIFSPLMQIDEKISKNYFNKKFIGADDFIPFFVFISSLHTLPSLSSNEYDFFEDLIGRFQETNTEDSCIATNLRVLYYQSTNK